MPASTKGKPVRPSHHAWKRSSVSGPRSISIASIAGLRFRQADAACATGRRRRTRATPARSGRPIAPTSAPRRGARAGARRGWIAPKRRSGERRLEVSRSGRSRSEAYSSRCSARNCSHRLRAAAGPASGSPGATPAGSAGSASPAVVVSQHDRGRIHGGQGSEIAHAVEPRAVERCEHAVTRARLVAHRPGLGRVGRPDRDQLPARSGERRGDRGVAARAVRRRLAGDEHVRRVEGRGHVGDDRRGGAGAHHERHAEVAQGGERTQEERHTVRAGGREERGVEDVERGEWSAGGAGRIDRHVQCRVVGDAQVTPEPDDHPVIMTRAVRGGSQPATT